MANPQTPVQRLVGDKKLLLALGIAMALIVGVGAFVSDESDKKKAASEPAPIASQPDVAPTAPVLEPTLATDFVKFWISNGLDYQSQTARASHVTAFQWMTPEALQTFKAHFWTPDIESGVESGQVVAVFQPASVQAEAINPDGTVVVGVNGTLVVQSNGTPATQQVAIDLLIRKDKEGLRVAGLANRQVAAAATSAAPGGQSF
jgi:hypothetical protein